jgi:hypothetical protein
MVGDRHPFGDIPMSDHDAHDHHHVEGEQCFVCMYGMDAYVEAAEDNIKRTGIHIVGVHGHEPGDRCYAYSIGLCDKGLPELIMVGHFSPSAYMQFINLFGQAMMKGSVQLEDWYEDRKVNPDFPIIFRELAKMDIMRHCNILRNIRSEPFRMFQIILPDKERVYPWQEGCSLAGQNDLNLQYMSTLKAGAGESKH